MGEIAKTVEPVSGQEERRFYAPPLTAPPGLCGQAIKAGKLLKWLPAQFNFERKSCLPFRECVHKFGTFCPEVQRGTRLSYTPCLLIKSVLRLRLYATQSQPCFPAASNVIALPSGNLIFAVTPTERKNTLHFESQVVCQGARPFGAPGQQNRLNFPVLDIQPLFVVSSPFFGLCTDLRHT